MRSSGKLPIYPFLLGASGNSCVQLISTIILYHKRFFSYHSSTQHGDSVASVAGRGRVRVYSREYERAEAEAEAEEGGAVMSPEAIDVSHVKKVEARTVNGRHGDLDPKSEVKVLRAHTDNSRSNYSDRSNTLCTSPYSEDDSAVTGREDYSPRKERKRNRSTATGL